MPSVYGKRSRASTAARLSLLLCLFTRPLGAEEEDGGDVAFLLVLLDIPSAETRDELADAVRSQTGDLNLRISFIDHEKKAGAGFSLHEAETMAAEHDADFVFLIRGDPDAGLILHVYDSSRRAMLVEEVRAQGEGLVVQVETAALVVRSYLLLLADGAHVGLEPPAPSKVAAEPLPEQRKETAANILEFYSGYSLTTLAPEKNAIHGMTVGLGAAPAPLRGLYFELAYTMSPDFSAHDDLVYLHVGHHPFILGLRYTLSRGRLRVLPGLAVLLEYVSRNTVIRDQEIAVTGDTDGLNAAIVPSARFSFNLFGHFDLFTQVGMDIYFRRMRYGYEYRGEGVELLRPWYVRFNLLIGIAANML